MSLLLVISVTWLWGTLEEFLTSRPEINLKGWDMRCMNSYLIFHYLGLNEMLMFKQNIFPADFRITLTCSPLKNFIKC